jgi:two-component system, OmpR family, sensor kinase
METMTVAEMTTVTTETPQPSPWRRFRGVRVRILGWYVLLLAVAIGASLLLARQILLQRLEDEVDASLRQETDEVRALATGSDPETGEPFGNDVAAVFETFARRNIPHEGEALYMFIPGQPAIVSAGPPERLDQDRELVRRWLDLRRSERGELDTASGPAEYLAVPLRVEGETAGVFVVANFVNAERAEVDDAIRVAALVSVSILILASAAAWFVAGRVLAPLRALTDSARTITDTDLTSRLPVKGDDEIAELTTTFNAMLERLDTAFATQRAFLDDAGHELRTPITIVRGHLEVMGDDPAEREETMALVSDELDRMARIVDELVLLAKAEQPGFLDRAPVEVEVLTHELLAKAGALAPREWRVDAAADVMMTADRQRLTQAVMNLADNATHHTENGQEIAIGSSATDAEVRIWVRDRGTGIAPEDERRIFDRFARASDGARPTDGAGLGLAIVKAVAEAHGGRVELASRPGHGSTFTIVLPRDDPRRPTWPAS